MERSVRACMRAADGEELTTMVRASQWSWRDEEPVARAASSVAAAEEAAVSVREAARAAQELLGSGGGCVTMRSGAAGAREQLQREASLRLSKHRVSFNLEHEPVDDVLTPDTFEAEEPESTAFIETGLRRLIVSDETGTVIDWPWETGPTRVTGG